MLNDRVAFTASSSYTHAPLGAKHTQTVDEFYPLPQSYSSSHANDAYGESKLRVSRDERTGQLLECIIKRRLGDLHVLSPKREVDWRISVNVEEKVDVGILSGSVKVCS